MEENSNDEYPEVECFIKRESHTDSNNEDNSEDFEVINVIVEPIQAEYEIITSSKNSDNVPLIKLDITNSELVNKVAININLTETCKRSSKVNSTSKLKKNRKSNKIKKSDIDEDNFCFVEQKKSAFCSMYSKIVSSEKTTNKSIDTISVFDFHDEEEEKRQKEQFELQQKVQALIEKTCKICQQRFADPIDVLRHKREAHKTEKIRMPKKQLLQYFQVKNKKNCPICFKEISKKGFKSMYEKHLMVHCEEYELTCNTCNMKFKRKDHLQLHEKRHVVLRPKDVILPIKKE